MECKSNYHSQCYTGFRELIDTLWNVNAVTRDLKIDAVSRINRYIMECK